MNYTQLNTPYQAKIEDIQDTGKVFTGGGIKKKKYIVTFSDGFQAEYCPPELLKLTFEKGDIVEFKTIHIGPKGIEIEVIGKVGAGGQTTPALKGGTFGVNSMVGHPAVVALTVAKDMALQNGWDWDTMLTKADDAMQWLIARKDLEQYGF